MGDGHAGFDKRPAARAGGVGFGRIGATAAGRRGAAQIQGRQRLDLRRTFADLELPAFQLVGGAAGQRQHAGRSQRQSEAGADEVTSEGIDFHIELLVVVLLF